METSNENDFFLNLINQGYSYEEAMSEVIENFYSTEEIMEYKSRVQIDYPEVKILYICFNGG